MNRKVEILPSTNRKEWYTPLRVVYYEDGKVVKTTEGASIYHADIENFLWGKD